MWYAWILAGLLSPGLAQMDPEIMKDLIDPPMDVSHMKPPVLEDRPSRPRNTGNYETLGLVPANEDDYINGKHTALPTGPEDGLRGRTRYKYIENDGGGNPLDDLPETLTKLHKWDEFKKFAAESRAKYGDKVNPKWEQEAAKLSAWAMSLKKELKVKEQKKKQKPIASFNKIPKKPSNQPSLGMSEYWADQGVDQYFPQEDKKDDRQGQPTRVKPTSQDMMDLALREMAGGDAKGLPMPDSPFARQYEADKKAYQAKIAADKAAQQQTQTSGKTQRNGGMPDYGAVQPGGNPMGGRMPDYGGMSPGHNSMMTPGNSGMPNYGGMRQGSNPMGGEMPDYSDGGMPPYGGLGENPMGGGMPDYGGMPGQNPMSRGMGYGGMPPGQNPTGGGMPDYGGMAPGQNHMGGAMPGYGGMPRGQNPINEMPGYNGMPPGQNPMGGGMPDYGGMPSDQNPMGPAYMNGGGNFPGAEDYNNYDEAGSVRPQSPGQRISPNVMRQAPANQMGTKMMDISPNLDNVDKEAFDELIAIAKKNNRLSADQIQVLKRGYAQRQKMLYKKLPLAATIHKMGGGGRQALPYTPGTDGMLPGTMRGGGNPQFQQGYRGLPQQYNNMQNDRIPRISHKPGYRQRPGQFKTSHPGSMPQPPENFDEEPSEGEVNQNPETTIENVDEKRDKKIKKVIKKAKESGHNVPSNSYMARLKESGLLPKKSISRQGNTTEGLLANLPKLDDFNSPIKWVPISSAQTEDGLARVTDKNSGVNMQRTINNTVYVPVVDYDPLRLGVTLEPTTMKPVPVTTVEATRNSVMDEMLRFVNPEELVQADWLAFDVTLNKREREDRCADQACQSRCTSLSCKTMCKGDTCAAGCVGVACKAYCHGPGCFAMCIGDKCEAQCNGGSCDARCRGEDCETNCAGFSCLKTTNGSHKQGGGTWQQHVAQYPDPERELKMARGPGGVMGVRGADYNYQDGY